MHCQKIAQGFRHLFAANRNVAIMHPIVREGGAVMGADALRQFILVMGKHQIDAAAMNIKGLTQ